MKQLLFVLSILILFLGSAEAAGPRKLKIGAALPLTGKLAFVGISSQRGIELARALQKNETALDLEVIYEDTEGDPKKGVAAAANLLRQDIDVLISSLTHVTAGIAPIVAAANKMMVFSGSSREIAAISPLFFRDWFDAEDSGVKIGQMLNERKKARIAYLGEENDACALYQKRVAETVQTPLITSESCSPGENDLGPLLLRIKSKHPDALALCTWRDTAILMRRMKELGMLSLQTFHAVAPFLPASDTPEVRKLLEQNKALSTWYGNAPSERNAMSDRFDRDFQAKYGEEARGESRYLYDDINFITDAARRCNDHDLKCIATYLKSYTFHGAAGTLRFDAGGVSKRAVTVQVVENGQWKVISE